MNGTINSDIDPAMLASQYFDRIISQIQTSSLNFQLQLSPFGAFISLKKTFVKNKKGVVVIPSFSLPSDDKKNEDVLTLTRENQELKNKLVTLQHELALTVNECAAAHKAVETFTHEKVNLENKNKGLNNEIKEQEISVINSEEENQNQCNKTSVTLTTAAAGCSNPSSLKSYSRSTTAATGTSTLREGELEDKIEINENVDLNYNVKVSNPFTPLLTVEESSPLSSASTKASHSLQQSFHSSPPYHTSPSPSPGRQPRTTPEKQDFNTSFNLKPSFQQIKVELAKVAKAIEENQEKLLKKVD